MLDHYETCKTGWGDLQISEIHILLTVGHSKHIRYSWKGSIYLRGKKSFESDVSNRSQNKMGGTKVCIKSCVNKKQLEEHFATN